MISAKIIADSIANDVRLTTMQLRFHRFILPEFNTHRMFSRNFSSSRAIPVAKMIEQVQNDPAMPVYWGMNKAGMQADEEIEDKGHVRHNWKSDAKYIASLAETYNDYGLHKQITNRILEPFQWVNGIVTATEWDNFFKLRDHSAAQPEIQALAKAMRKAMDESEPRALESGEWHLPYVTLTDYDYENIDMLRRLSAARCARVSYLNHDQSDPDPYQDLALADRLLSMGHLSPFEHQATPIPYDENEDWHIDMMWQDIRGVTHHARDSGLWSGNFRSWLQWRQML